MPAKKGHYLGGIRTVECLRQRSFVNPETGCWEWRLRCEQGSAKVHFVPPGTDRKLICKGRRAALWLLRGHDVPAGHVAYRRYTCAHECCVNPAHAASGTPQQWGQERRQGQPLVAQQIKVRASLQAWDKRGRKVTPEMVREIRTSPDSVAKLATRLGLSQFGVWSVRTGQTHKHVPPFVTLQSALMGHRVPEGTAL